MRKFVLMAAVAVTAIFNPFNQAHAGKDKNKIQVVFEETRENGSIDLDDCKISDKELSAWEKVSSNKPYICSQISMTENLGLGVELTPESLGRLVDLDKEEKYKLSLIYTGTDVQGILKTLGTWQKFLVENEGKAEVANWSVEVSSQNESAATLRYKNASAGQSFEFQIQLGQELIDNSTENDSN